VVLLMHGEPSWSYLYRTMIPVLTAAGLQIVAPDLVGFGRSDKPAERSDYTYARHVEWMRELLFDHLELRTSPWWPGLGRPHRTATGGRAPGALRPGRGGQYLPAHRRHRSGRGLLQLAALLPGGGGLPDRLHRQLRLPQRSLPQVRAAYDAPFPDESYKSGARAFPMLVPSRPDDPAHDANVAAWVGLAAFDRPFLTAFATAIRSPGAHRALQERIAGARGQPHTTIVGASHFLQEDCGEELARVVVDFVAS
jgi:haloalkane dehalogenase